ncbi:MAG TPA: YicC/YloC family endoribonuclease, partial [Patescibacteria group bacterium]|nr:YicC/YloC family endoribonuclease [Patescibacteria group bacterium]
MMQSMTGFATKNAIITSASGKKASISLSLKSLNGKFFELNCKLPLALSHLETIVLKQLKNKLKRGHIFLMCYLNNTDIIQGTVEPAINVAHNYVKAIEQIKKECDIGQSITLDHILRLPNIFNVQEQLADEYTEKNFLNLIDELADEVHRVRIKEGQEITQD